MPFEQKIKEEALVNSRRCCCVCQKFAGLYTNIHHIVQESDGGSNKIENAIALCLRCHGEAGHYNQDHPIGNKYSPSELRKHRDKWWKWCNDNPASGPKNCGLNSKLDVHQDGKAEFYSMEDPKIHALYFKNKKFVKIDYCNPDYNYKYKQILVSGGDLSKPIWSEYIESYPKTIQPYVLEIRKVIEHNNWHSKTGEDMNMTLFEFLDGVTFVFTWRAWGDLIQALHYQREGFYKHYMQKRKKNY